MISAGLFVIIMDRTQWFRFIYAHFDLPDQDECERLAQQMVPVD
jgi:hypothetical protein